MSLIDCIKKLKVSPERAAEIKKSAKKYERGGMDKLEAEQAAIRDAIDDASSNLDQLREKTKAPGSIGIEAPSPKEQIPQQFNQADRTRKQGATIFTPDYALIRLMGADRSTLLHEMGHVWLNYLFKLSKSGSSTAEAQHHWSQIKDFLGVSDEQEKLTTEQQEKWARHLEAYVMEGEAPNAYLRKAFRNFARWLVQVYKNVQGISHQAGFEVKLSDDARAIFDRLMSTEEEINQAQQSFGNNLGAIDEKSLAPAVQKKLQDLRDSAHGEAFDTLVKAQMAELSKQHKAELEAQRDKREPEIRKEIESQPIYKAISQVKDVFGRDAKNVAQDFLAGKLSEDESASLEMASKIAGFSSADHLANMIIKTEPVHVAVNAQLTAEQKPNIMDTAAIREMAEQAVHNNKAIELMALELSILEQKVLKANEKALTDEANKAILRNAAEPEDVLREARARLAKLSASEAGSFRRYYTAERNAAVKVAKALKAKDYQAAAEAKRQQLVAHTMAIESQKLRTQVEKNLKYLEKSRQLDPEKLGRQEHYEQLAKLLNRFGFEMSGFDPGIPTAPLSQWIETVDPDQSEINIADWILDEAFKKPAKELTTDQLQDVRDAAENIRHYAAAENKLEAFGDKITSDAIEAELIAASQEHVKKRKKPDVIEAQGRVAQLVRTAKSYNASLAGVRDTLKILGGDNEDTNPYLKYFWRIFYDAYDVEAKLLKKTAPELAKVWAEYSKKEIKELIGKPVFIEELGVSVPRIYLVSMARNLGNETSKMRLFETPPVGIDRSAWGEANVMRVLSKYLSAKDWRSVQAAWDAAESIWPDAAAHHKEMTGFMPGKIEALPFSVVTKDGEAVHLKGGYFPLVADPRDVTRGGAFAQLAEDLETPLYQENNPGWKGVTKTGYTKARAQGAKYAVKIQESILPKHLNEVAHDIAFRKPVRDAQRILARPAVKAEIIAAVGRDRYDELVANVKGAASGYQQQRPENRFARVIEDTANFLTIRTTASVLIGKIGPVIQNFANFALLPGAIRDFGWKDTVSAMVFKGAFDYWGKGAVAWKLAAEKRAYISEKSSFMAERFNNPDYTLAASRIEQLGGPGMTEQVKEFAGSWLAWTENFIAVPAWEQAYEQELERNGGNEKEAVHYADNLIINALGSPRKYDTASAVKVRGAAKSFVMFYSFLSTYQQRWRAELRQSGRSSKVVSPKLLGFIAAQMLLFVPLSQLLSGKLPHGNDDEDEPTKWLKWLLRSNADNIFGMFPVMRDVLQYATDKATGEATYGGIRVSPVAGSISTLEKTINLLQKDYEAEGEKQKAAEVLTKAMSIVAPYPDQANILFWNAYDMFENGSSFKPEDLLRRRKALERGQ